MLVPAIGLVVASVIGFNVIGQSTAHAANDCDNNAVIRCGYTSPAGLASTTASNAELQAIYNHPYTSGYGMGSTSSFAANAKHATAYKDGRLVLDDGTVVATSTASLGRQTGNGNNHSIVINGKTYYWGYNQTAFAANSIPAYVVLNDDHSLKFAALTSCGNPIWGTSPGYECKMLQQTKVSDTTYDYVATPYMTNGASIDKIVYDFGDGKSQTVTSNFSQKVTHTYAPGNYTARATVYFKVNGQEKSDTRAECTKPVSVPQPPKKVFTCDSLTFAPINNSRTNYTFTVKGSSTNTSLQTAKIDFGDGQAASGLKTTDGKSVTTTHNYAKDGTYTAKAYLTFDAGTTAETTKCMVTVTVVPETCANTPNKPECQPKTCANTPSLPECQPQTPPTPPQTCENTPSMAGCQALPSTGPEEVVGSVLGLGSLTGAGLYYRNTRRDWINAIFRRNK